LKNADLKKVIVLREVLVGVARAAAVKDVLLGQIVDQVAMTIAEAGGPNVATDLIVVTVRMEIGQRVPQGRIVLSVTIVPYRVTVLQELNRHLAEIVPALTTVHHVVIVPQVEIDLSDILEEIDRNDMVGGTSLAEMKVRIGKTKGLVRAPTQVGNSNTVIVEAGVILFARVAETRIQELRLLAEAVVTITETVDLIHGISDQQHQAVAPRALQRKLPGLSKRFLEAGLQNQGARP
jgi:hypothetical protein